MSLIHETDFGTPRSKSRTMVTLTIDGESVTVPEGTSIMRAAMEAGTQIPKLCATDMVDAFGSCRLCLVEIEGRAGTPDLGARRHLDHACGDGGRHANSKALRDRHGGCIRLVPALPGRNRRPRGNARFLHHAGHAGPRGPHPDRTAEASPQGRDGALHLGSAARLPHLRCQWRLRIAGHGGRSGPARRAIRI